jgi:hypothetical protein
MKDDEEAIKEKVRAGLTREQAVEVLKAQAEHDAAEAAEGDLAGGGDQAGGSDGVDKSDLSDEGGAKPKGKGRKA